MSTQLKRKVARRGLSEMKIEVQCEPCKDECALVELLKLCTDQHDLHKGSKLHACIKENKLLEKNPYIGSALINMYAKFGKLSKAQEVLEELPVRDVVTWSALITGYAQHGQGEKALKCFDDMLREGHSPDVITFICVLKACGSIGATAKGEEIHDKVVILGMIDKDLVVGNTLVDMYAKCGALSKAQQVLEDLPSRDVVTWNALIAGYAQQGQGGKALKCFDDMLCDGHLPDAVTFISLLKACGSIKAAAKGKEIHCKIVINFAILGKDVVLGTSLMDMYVKCGALSEAQRVLKDLPFRNVVTWSALIAGYAQQGQGEEALKCFDDMLHEGHSPNVVTFVCVLKACGSLVATAMGEKIHNTIDSLGILQKDIMLRNALVDMYVKCGSLTKAHQVLKELPVRDMITWTTLIAGYIQQGQGEEALKCFDDMLHEGHSPDAVTLICVLKACGSIGAATRGEKIHDKIDSLGMLEKDVVLGNTLVDMYMKYGALDKAQKVLEELHIQDVVTCSALIAGYAQQGQSLEAVNCFERMQKAVRPNSITLISMLHACSHSGQLDQAETYFSGMSTKYGICPDLEHYRCMIDLFGRAGKFNKALLVIAEMPCNNCLSLWVTLLGACRKWEEVKIGRLAFEHALDLDKSIAAVYILMANIYTGAGIQEEADKMHIMRVANMAWKIPSCC